EALLVSSAVPTAVNTTLLAIEYQNEPEFASQVVLATTVASGVTCALWILLAQRVFG
ncbi:MAG: transporter, partial [Rubrivivax sp.]|nr:transporter [Rubrivivax sp.]